jgi:hypothetical protein
MQRFAPRAASATVSYARRWTSITEPIGKGKVVPLKFDSLKPVYIPRSFAEQVFVLNFWQIINLIPLSVISFTLIFAAHGGFQGRLPPDPKALHK